MITHNLLHRGRCGIVIGSSLDLVSSPLRKPSSRKWVRECLSGDSPLLLAVHRWLKRSLVSLWCLSGTPAPQNAPHGVSGGLAYSEARDALAESVGMYRLVRACYVKPSPN